MKTKWFLGLLLMAGLAAPVYADPCYVFETKCPNENGVGSSIALFYSAQTGTYCFGWGENRLAAMAQAGLRCVANGGQLVTAQESCISISKDGHGPGRRWAAGWASDRYQAESSSVDACERSGNPDGPGPVSPSQSFRPDADFPRPPDDGLDLTGSATELCLPQALNELGTRLACRNAPYFANLHALLPQGTGLGLTGATDYYWRYAPNLMVWVQNQPGATSSLGAIGGGVDAALPASEYETIGDAMAAMTWALQMHSAEVLGCGYAHATSNIPYSQSQLASRLKDELFTYTTTIAIGGMSQYPNASGFSYYAFTYSSPHIRRYPNNHFARMYELTLNVVPSNTWEVPSMAASIFHELLHSFGFNHGGNSSSAYQDRTKAILALEDCMETFVRNNPGAWHQ